jgi:hypothetical protein
MVPPIAFYVLLMMAEMEDKGDNVPSTTSASESSGVDESMVPATPPAKEDQLGVLTTALTARIELGTNVYLVPAKWYKAFTAWARGETTREPGRVDPQGMLCDVQGVLREGLLEDIDWHASNEQGWNLIQRW